MKLSNDRPLHKNVGNFSTEFATLPFSSRVPHNDPDIWSPPVTVSHKSRSVTNVNSYNKKQGQKASGNVNNSLSNKVKDKKKLKKDDGRPQSSIGVDKGAKSVSKPGKSGEQNQNPKKGNLHH